MSPILETIRKRRMSRRMHHCINCLSPMLTPVISRDEWGHYVEGLHSNAIAVRAREAHEDHEPDSWPWFEAEAARLVLRVLADDALGARSLPTFEAVAGGVAQEIIARTRQLVPTWVESM